MESTVGDDGAFLCVIPVPSCRDKSGLERKLIDKAIAVNGLKLNAYSRLGNCPALALARLQIRVQRFDSASGLQRADAAPLLWVPALIPGSSVVEQAAVNRWVDGSNPSRGANHDGGQERYS